MKKASVILISILVMTSCATVSDVTTPVSYTHLTLPDDLLCVDLGGRRIIKKKNSNIKLCNPNS